jgi:hypothetical protein
MNKAQALDKFWNSFGIPAYDELTVPEEAVMPYITYSVTTGRLEDVVNLSASIWYHSQSWKDISLKAEEIAEKITKMMPPTIQIDNGRLYIALGDPFAQRMDDPSSDTVRRIYLNVQAEFLTAY